MSGTRNNSFMSQLFGTPVLVVAPTRAMAAWPGNHRQPNVKRAEISSAIYPYGRWSRGEGGVLTGGVPGCIIAPRQGRRANTLPEASCWKWK